MDPVPTADGSAHITAGTAAPGRRRLTLWGLFSTAVAVCCLATVAGYTGRLGWPFELACHFRVQYFLALLLAAVILFLGKRRRSAAAAGIFCLANGIVILPLYFGAGTDITAGSSQYRIMLLNVHSGNTDYKATLDLIRSETPDIVILEEVNLRWKTALEELADTYPHRQWDTREDNFGIAILSSIPFDVDEKTDFGPAAVPTIVAGFPAGRHIFTVIGTHPLPPASRDYFSMRNRQLDELAAFAADLEGHVIVIGDLNTTSWSPFFQDFLKKSGLRDSRRGFGVQRSWPTFNALMWIPLDHCLISPDISVRDRRVGPDVGSDHFPIIIDIVM